MTHGLRRPSCCLVEFSPNLVDDTDWSNCTVWHSGQIIWTSPD